MKTVYSAIGLKAPQTILHILLRLVWPNCLLLAPGEKETNPVTGVQGGDEVQLCGISAVRAKPSLEESTP
jgi:hypothetical protein